MIPKYIWILVFTFIPLVISCQFSPYPDDVFNGIEDDGSPTETRVRDIGGNPSTGSQDIYASSDLGDLCLKPEECHPDYNRLPVQFTRTQGQHPLASDHCNFDYDPNVISTFVLNRVEGPINGLDLFLSKEDLFFIAWVAMRYHINPYFLLGVISQESAGNCAAVSASHGEGCFQITNTFGQGQLNDSYPHRVVDWFWSDQSGSYYPDSVFVDEFSTFGEFPPSEQFRVTLDPREEFINGIQISSVVNFHFGAIASAFYFHWQQYLLYYYFDDLRTLAGQLFQRPDGKAHWQAAAYNGGAFGAGVALKRGGLNFLGEMSDESHDYALAVADYCQEYQRGELTYSAEYTLEDISWIINLLSMTYPQDSGIDWDAVLDDVRQVFFEDGTETLTFVDDVKALVYVISTHDPYLSPEWPDEGSI